MGASVEHLQLQPTIKAMPVPPCGTSALHILLAPHACATHACSSPPHAAPSLPPAPLCLGREEEQERSGGEGDAAPGREGRGSVWRWVQCARACFVLAPPAQQLAVASFRLGGPLPACPAPLPCRRGGQARWRWRFSGWRTSAGSLGGWVRQ